MVRFESVSMRYRAGSAHDVLHDVNLDLADGSFRWLLGEPGVGKTTARLINMSLRWGRQYFQGLLWGPLKLPTNLPQNAWDTIGTKTERADTYSAWRQHERRARGANVS